MSTSKSPFPAWLKIRLPAQPDPTVHTVLQQFGLNTVCQSAQCPNQAECRQKHRATFMLMGASCTRNCGFCAVDHDKPQPLDANEPLQVAKAVQALGIRHAVITSVTRDDLPDGGAAHFVATVQAIRQLTSASCEILTPDFAGNRSAWQTVTAVQPEVLNHNIETVPRLYATVRPQADYQQSLDFLRFGRDQMPDKCLVKSGLMLGLGETLSELTEVAKDLFDHGAQMVTIGQYLRPSKDNLPVQRYVTPEEFSEIGALFVQAGIKYVASHPLVRSSHDAEEFYSGIATKVCDL